MFIVHAYFFKIIFTKTIFQVSASPLVVHCQQLGMLKRICQDFGKPCGTICGKKGKSGYMIVNILKHKGWVFQA